MMETDKLLDAICVVLTGWTGAPGSDSNKAFIAARELIYDRAAEVTAREKEDTVLAQADKIRSKRAGAKNGGLARLGDRT